MASGDYLFSTHNLADDIEHRRKKMREEIGNLTSSELKAKEDSMWLDHFEQEYRFEVPQIQHDKIQSERREVDVDVSGDPNRNLFRDSGPILVRGSEVTYFVPYEGESLSAMRWTNYWGMQAGETQRLRFSSSTARRTSPRCWQGFRKQ